MRDTDLYKAILGLTSPWTVVTVDLDIKGQQVTITMDAGEGPFPCPECQTVVPGYSPELNPDAFLNNDVKSNALGRRRPREAAELVTAVRSYLWST